MGTSGQYISCAVGNHSREYDEPVEVEKEQCQ